MREKRAAIELSMGTIVVIVLSVIMLILGVIFIRSIMCAGIVGAEEINKGMLDEIRGLFGEKKYGVKCLGEVGEISLLSGGNRNVVCLIKVDETSEYKLTVEEIESLKGASKQVIEDKWVIDKDWEGSVSTSDETQAVVLKLSVPRDADATSLKIKINAENLDSGSKTTHVSYIDIKPSSFFTGAVC